MCIRDSVYTPNAPALPPAPAAGKRAKANPLAFAGAGPALSPRQPRASAPKRGAWGASQRGAAADEGGARKKARRGGASAAAQALDQRPTLVVLYPQPGPGGNPLTAYKYPSLSAARKRAQGLVENVQFTIRVPPEGGDGASRRAPQCLCQPQLLDGCASLDGSSSLSTACMAAALPARASG